MRGCSCMRGRRPHCARPLPPSRSGLPSARQRRACAGPSRPWAAACSFQHTTVSPASAWSWSRRQAPNTLCLGASQAPWRALTARPCDAGAQAAAPGRPGGPGARCRRVGRPRLHASLGSSTSSRACSSGAWQPPMCSQPAASRCTSESANPPPPPLPAHSAALLLAPAAADVSRPGGAGHALLFKDNGVVLRGFKDLGAPTAGRFGGASWRRRARRCLPTAP